MIVPCRFRIFLFLLMICDIPPLSTCNCFPILLNQHHAAMGSNKAAVKSDEEIIADIVQTKPNAMFNHKQLTTMQG